MITTVSTVEVEVASRRLSGRAAEPDGAPRAVVFALHGMIAMTVAAGIRVPVLHVPPEHDGIWASDEHAQRQAERADAVRVPDRRRAGRAAGILLLEPLGFRTLFAVGALPLVTLVPLAIWLLPEPPSSRDPRTAGPPPAAAWPNC